MQRCQGFILPGGVSTGEPDIVSLGIMSSQRTMSIYGQGEWSKSANKVQNRCVCVSRGRGSVLVLIEPYIFRSKWTGLFASYSIRKVVLFLL